MSNTNTAETTMTEVTKETFFKTMGPLDVHPEIQEGKYPYISIWKDKKGNARGKSSGNKYYLASTK